MIKFGPSGNSQRFYDEGNNRTIEAAKWLYNLGLNAYEYSFGRGINISDATAQDIGREFNKYGVEISVHAPYYINFANPDDSMAEKSYNYVINSCRKLQQFGGNRVVFHPATVGKMQREDAVALAEKRIAQLVERIYLEGLDNYMFCPETMGKINQIGDVQEIVRFCNLDKCLIPCVDFGHLNARTMGSLKTDEDFEKLVVYMLDNLDFYKVDNMHIHFSKIEFAKGGEVRHLTFADQMYGPDFSNLAEVLKKYNLNPYIVCESDGTQADDAITMKNIYYSL